MNKRIALVLAGAAVLVVGLMYTVSVFPPPSTTRCFATDPAAMFYVVVNEDGTFSRIE